MDAKQWYRNLSKPAWAPDEKVFGQVWSVLYPIIAVVNVWVIILLIQNKIELATAVPFWVNLGFNATFSPVQFGLRNNALASVNILLVLATLIWAMIAIWPHAFGLALAFVPYTIWVSIASLLQLQITAKN